MFPKHAGLGRAGLALYGISPFGGSDDRLKPVMRLSTRIFGERVLQPHSPIGYGATFYTSKSTRVGLIACGYADGYPRRAQAIPRRCRRQIDPGHRQGLYGYDDHRAGRFARRFGTRGRTVGDTVNINTVAEAAGTILTIDVQYQTCKIHLYRVIKSKQNAV